MSLPLELSILILGVVATCFAFFWHFKSKSWESAIAVLGGISGCIYIVIQLLSHNTHETNPTIINNSTIYNYYPISRDTVLYSTRVFNHHIIDTAYIRDTTFVNDTAFLSIEEMKIFSDRVMFMMPPETQLKVEASAFITILNPSKVPIQFSFSPNFIQAEKLFDCNSLGINDVKIYAFMDNKKIKVLNADLEIRDPDDFCRLQFK